MCVDNGFGVAFCGVVEEFGLVYWYEKWWCLLWFVNGIYPTIGCCEPVAVIFVVVEVEEVVAIIVITNSSQHNPKIAGP